MPPTADGGTLPLFVFGSQGPANFVEPLLALIEDSYSHSHTVAFLQLALEAVRDEITSIHNPNDLSVFPAIGTFASLAKLARWHREERYENATINGILLVIAQAAQIILGIETSPSLQRAFLDPDAHFAGFCTGAITAAAFALATDSISDAIRQGVEAVRLVFWVSLRSAQEAKTTKRYEKQQGPQSWSCVLVGVKPSEAEQLLVKFNDILVSL